MFGMTALELARTQFAFTVSVHIIFPAITIGLASFLVVLEALWLWTEKVVYRSLYIFWSKVFAINFGMGVVSGLVMSYEFGTNWSPFSAFAGGVTGPLLAYEVLTAFFLEAGFLGVMLFGLTKVGRGLHFFATCMVALGTLISTTWILASNSWLQTPQGFAIENGRVVPTDWLAVIFNPSFPYRLIHMTLAAYLATALIVAASGAWHLLRGSDTAQVKKMFSMALWLLLVLGPVQIAVGDAHGLNTLEFQPAKIAAIEGHWNPEPNGTPLIVFGIPDMEAETTKYAIEIPYLGSLILTHSLRGTIPDLKSFRPEDRPNSTLVFWTFRMMVGIGFLIVILAAFSVYFRIRDRLYKKSLFLWSCVIMGPMGLVAILLGWITTEAGRQPWIVYNVMRTAQGVTPHSVETLSFTLCVFVIVYFLVFGVGIIYLLRVIHAGPDDTDVMHGPVSTGRPARPLSAAPDTIDPLEGGNEG